MEGQVDLDYISLEQITTASNMAGRCAPLSTNTYIPYEEWKSEQVLQTNGAIRLYACALDNKLVPKNPEDVAGQRCSIHIDDQKAVWTYNTLQFDPPDNDKSAVYFCWSGNHPIVFVGVLSSMKLKDCKVYQYKK